MASTKRSWQDRMRERIQTSKYMDKLEAFIFEGEELSRDQITVILSLMDRVLPKVSAQDIRHEHFMKEPREMSFSELQKEWDSTKEKHVIN